MEEPSNHKYDHNYQNSVYMRAHSFAHSSSFSEGGRVQYNLHDRELFGGTEREQGKPIVVLMYMYMVICFHFGQTLENLGVGGLVSSLFGMFSFFVSLHGSVPKSLMQFRPVVSLELFNIWFSQFCKTVTKHLLFFVYPCVKHKGCLIHNSDAISILNLHWIALASLCRRSDCYFSERRTFRNYH